VHALVTVFFPSSLSYPFLPCGTYWDKVRGVARIFQRGVTVRQSEGTHQSVMLFLPPVACCLLQKDLQKGRSGAPKDPPSYPPEGYTVELILLQVSFLIVYFLAAI